MVARIAFRKVTSASAASHRPLPCPLHFSRKDGRQRLGCEGLQSGVTEEVENAATDVGACWRDGNAPSMGRLRVRRLRRRELRRSRALLHPRPSAASGALAQLLREAPLAHKHVSAAELLRRHPRIPRMYKQNEGGVTQLRALQSGDRAATYVSACTRMGGEFALKLRWVCETNHDNAAATYNSGSQ